MAELAGSLLCHGYLWSSLVCFLCLLCHEQTESRQNYFDRKSFFIDKKMHPFPFQKSSSFPIRLKSFFQAFEAHLKAQVFYHAFLLKCTSFEFQDELFYIETSLPVKFQSKDFKMPPFKDMFLSLPVWALLLAHMGNNWGMYTLLTEMPTYLTSVHHFDISSVRISVYFWKLFGLLIFCWIFCRVACFLPSLTFSCGRFPFFVGCQPPASGHRR